MMKTNLTREIKSYMALIKDDFLNRPLHYLLLVIALGPVLWLSGLLDALTTGIALGPSDYNIFNVGSIIYHTATPLSTLAVASFIFALFFIWHGGIWRFIGKTYLKVVCFAMVWASASLYSYKYFYHDNISVMPWYWFPTTILHTPEVGHLKILQYLSAGLALFMIGLLVYIVSQSVKSKLGYTRFAHVWDIQKVGLFSEEGIVLAKAHGTILRTPGFEGALVVAPMGSGKTTAVAIPNLIEWRGSAVINDLKGELWAKTAAYRKNVLRQACYCFAPGNEAGSNWCYNPFAYVSSQRHLWYRDIQLIAQALIPDDGGQATFWLQSSRGLFLLFGLYLFETNGTATLGEIYQLAKQPELIPWLNKIVDEGRGLYSKELIDNTASLLNADERTRSNILQDFFARMSLYGDPIIQQNTSKNDFDLRELRKKPMSIYINIPEREIERLSPLLTLFWIQLVDCLTVKEPDHTEPYPVLALLDEFGNLSCIEKFRKGMSFLRSYRIVFVVILQYLGQLTSVYGKEGAKGFLNTKVKMIFTLANQEDAEYFSDYMGQTTVKIKTRSVTGGEHSRVTINEHEHLRPLMRPEEILRMSAKQALIMVEGSYPIRAKKCFWFKNRYYRKSLRSYQS